MQRVLEPPHPRRTLETLRHAAGQRISFSLALCATLLVSWGASSRAQTPTDLGAAVPSSSALAAEPALGTIALEEIERGQTGYGLSVFSGTEPERFELEVVGVLRNLNPGMSFILAELRGQGLEESGVAGGMSGSPVYIDGRLAGAVAFSWNFSKGALAGITPIASMRQLHQAEGSGAGAAATLPPGAKAEAGALFARLLERGNGRTRLEAALRDLPLAAAIDNARFGAMMLTSGFSGSAALLLQSELTARGFASAAAGRADAGLEIPPLGAGSTVIGVLVGGDLQMAVSGTVTERDGDEVLAFGHPFLGIGPMNVPMAKGEVVTVVSSQASSFKLTNSGPVVGAFEQDRLPGLRGRVGQAPPTTPMTIRLSGTPRGEQRYDLEFADLPAMRPGLFGVSLLQTIEAASRAAGDHSLDMRVTIELAGHPPLLLDQSFDGGGAAFDAAIYLLQVSGFIELNPYMDVTVEAVDVEIDLHEGLRQRRLVDAFPSRRVVRPGEMVKLHLEFAPHRERPQRASIEVTVPRDLRSGPYYLFVGDGVSTDAAKLQMLPRSPDGFEETLAQLASFRSARDLVVLGARAARGLAFDGRSLSDLPASVRALWGTARKTEIKRTSLALEQELVERQEIPIDGIVRIDLRVEEDA